jgi:hypothetical protein
MRALMIRITPMSGPGLQGTRARCCLKSGVPDGVGARFCISDVKQGTVGMLSEG